MSFRIIFPWVNLLGWRKLSKVYVIDVEKRNTYSTSEMQMKKADLLKLNDEERKIFYHKVTLGRKELSVYFGLLSYSSMEIENIIERMRV